MEAISQESTQLLERFQAIRRQTMSICHPLSTEDYTVQPHDDVSPPKWHLGHTTWFFENFILVPFASNYKVFNQKLNWFFNSYYESQGPRINRSQRGNMTRPSIQTVFSYREYVDQHLEQLLIDGHPQKSEILDLLEVGLQHEQQHQELLVMDIKYILGSNPTFPTYLPTNRNSKSDGFEMNFHSIEEGLYTIGYSGEKFCWDNEQSSHKVYLESFEIADRMVTNGEYLEFMNSGGYSNHEYWLSEGWEWAKKIEIKAPLYWYEQEGNWQEYNLNGGLSTLNLNAPVNHINYFEADAFAAWKGMRLPTEFEWEAACKILQPSIPEGANFLEKNRLGTKAKEDSKNFQFFGEAWEWTASSYLPYPRYPRFKGALGEYNGKFMVNQMVLRGGSFGTPVSHIRPTYRNFFPTNKRWQITGIRLVKNK